MQDMHDLADRFFAAVEAGDIDTVRDCYDPAVAIWHNTDDLEQTRDENLATLAGMALRLGPWNPSQPTMKRASIRCCDPSTA